MKNFILRKNRSLFIALVIVSFGYVSFGYSVNLSPEKNWRYIPEKVTLNPAQGDWQALLSGKDMTWSIGTESAWVAVKLPATKKPHRILWTFGGFSKRSQEVVILECSADSKSGADGSWVVLEKKTCQWPLEKVVISTKPVPFWYRLMVTSSTERKITDIGLYQLGGKKRKDYWLILGASIQAQSIRNSVFKRFVQERFAGYDPVVFNLAVSGWRSDHLRKALPEFLAEHPEASYIGIHIGGNNVTQYRPYPGGANQLKQDLIAILTMIKRSGKIPILSRLSYRAYKTEPVVPPEENGSGPYVTNIYDPLIRKYCPLFFDRITGKGKVNAYDWFKDHPEELSADGIHVNKIGEESWNRLWVEGAGTVIYSP
ncbi:MAG: SGNH/GDSL hydrolase family protein [bacterium]|nr:SGNH/GDSL hydrolase family protein [bacterium]